MQAADGNGRPGVVVSIAGTSLPGASPAATVQIPSGGWPKVLRAIVWERLTGLAVAAAEEGWLALRDDQLEELLELHRSAMVWALRVEQTLLAAYWHLESEGVFPIVLKGSALAHSLYPDPSLRAFRDVDLLVPDGEWRRACSALEARGMRRRLPEPRAGFDERFGKAAVYTGGDGVQIDLHRSLIHGPFAQWMDPSELFAMTASFELAGTTLRRLDDTALLLHACIHASLGWAPPELLPVRDVAQISTVGDVDWDSIERLAGAWHTGAVIVHAFETTSRTFGSILPAPAKRLMDMEVGVQERRALRAYTSNRRRRGAMIWPTLRSIRGARAKVAYITALVFPNREFMASRSGHGERVSYLRRWLIPLRWIGRRRG